MCGILAAFGKNLDSEDLKLRSKLLTHRGPENFGDLVAANFYVSHNRLSIIETSSASNQPFVDERYVLIYNGEIYNHHEIRKNYGLNKCKTSSDTETLFYLLQSRGVEGLQYLRGMFAGIFIDKKEGRGFAFRDSLGIKPLMYREVNKNLYFSSEAKSLLNFDGNPEKVNQEALLTYLKFENYPSPVNLFSSLSSLRAGEVFSFAVDNPSVIVKSYFEYRPREDSFDTNVASRVRKVITKSVEEHLLSDVEVGVYMSGGVDSTLVATLAKKYNPAITAFTGYFDLENPYYDERSIARDAAKLAGITLNEVKIGPNDFIHNFSNLNYHLDAPRMGMGSFSQFMVAKEVAKHVKVVLAGHGGDEVFCGYPIHKIAYLKQQGLLKNLSSVRAKDLPWLLDLEWNRFKTGKTKFAPELMSAKKSKLDSAFYFNDSSLVNINAYYKDLYIQGLLDVEDKVSMSHSLETRMPLWTQDVLHQLYGIDSKVKMPNGVQKGLLKEVFKDVLPASVISGPKKGFPTPLRLWFKAELYDFVYESLKDRSNPLFQFVEHSKVIKILESHKKVPLPFMLDERRAHQIWMFLSLADWFRQFKVST